MEDFLGGILYYLIRNNQQILISVLIVFILGLMFYFRRKQFYHNRSQIIHEFAPLTITFDVLKLVICAGSVFLAFMAFVFYFFTLSPPDYPKLIDMPFLKQISVIFTALTGITTIAIFLYILFYIGSLNKVKEKRKLFISVIFIDLFIVGLFFMTAGMY